MRKHEHETPFHTPELPGTGGEIRERLEDFVVEELPLYEPVGAGEHLYLRIQKTGISTHEAMRRIGAALALPSGRIGYAGLKDARAIVHQTLSVAGVSEARARALDVPGVDLLDVQRHKNKLRVGHLRGNRFLIRVRGVSAGADETARAVLDRLAVVGVPNYFGAQRFGSAGRSHEVGRRLVRGDAEGAVAIMLGQPTERETAPRLRDARRSFDVGDLKGAHRAFPSAFHAERRVLEALIGGKSPDQAVRRIPRGVHRLLESAYQAFLFNRLVRGRIGSLGRLEAGDLAYLHDRGAVFRVEDPETEQPRADEFEISPSAPLYGKKVLLAEGEPGERERRLLEEEDLTLELFAAGPVKLDGERRPMRVPLAEPRVRAEGEDAILLTFELPKGSFATAVLREVMKSPGNPALEIPS